MKILRFLFLVFAAAAQAADPVGQPIALQGAVSAQAPSAPVRTLALKGPVFMQDAIRTGADAKAQILFADDTVFSQGPNTEVTIDSFVYDPVNTKNNGFKAKVERGVFRTVTGKITDLNPDKFEIKTGRATIGIRGCGVSAQLTDKRDEISIDYVRTGRVVVVTPFGGQPVEFREPGLIVIEDGVRVRKQRFDAVRFVAVMGETTPNGRPRRRGLEGTGGGGFRREAQLIQEEVVVVTPPAPKPSARPGAAKSGSEEKEPAVPWPVFDGVYNGFAMLQWEGSLGINPLDYSAQDPLHADENFTMRLYSEQPDPAVPGGKLYDWPMSVIMAASRMALFGSKDVEGAVTSRRIDAETFESHLTGADYDATMRVQRGGPESDWFKGWWGVDGDTPSSVTDADGLWIPARGFAVFGNTYSAAETAGLKSDAATYTLRQSGAGWAAGLGTFSWLEGAVPSQGAFVMSGTPNGTLVRIGGGQDEWSTRLQLQGTPASGVPVLCDVGIAGSLLDPNQRFNATVTPTVNTLTIDGHDFKSTTPQAFGTGRLVGSKKAGTLPTGLIGSVALSGFYYQGMSSGNYRMNMQFGTDLKKVDGGVGP
jgi:hypothetical protein